MHTVISNCNLLQKHVTQALKDGFYPIILGGDNCQTVGSAGALKRVSPDTKTLWVDSMIDINLQSKKEFNVLEMQTGMPFKS
jgi:arginase family enzyme